MSKWKSPERNGHNEEQSSGLSDSCTSWKPVRSPGHTVFPSLFYTTFQSFKSYCLQSWHLMPGTRGYVRNWTSWPMKELRLVGKAVKMAWGAVLQKDNHIPLPINHKESGLRLWFQSCLLLVFKYLLSYNIIMPHEWRLGLSKTAWSLPRGAGREAEEEECHYFMMGSEVVEDFLLGSRRLKRIDMHHPNASLLSILTPHYCLAPETDLMEDVTTAMLSSVLLISCLPFPILILRKKWKCFLTC